MVKDVVKSLILRTKMLNAAAYFKSNAVILRYHSVKDNPQEHVDRIDASIIHSTAEFEQQMEYIARNSNIVTMDEIADALDSGRELPRWSIAVTFDDGFKDNFEIARPIMNRYGIPSTIYVSTAYVKDRQIPWYIDLRHMFLNSPKKLWVDSKGNKTYNLETKSAALEAFFKCCEYCAALSGDDQRSYLQSIQNELSTDALVDPEMMMDFDDLRTFIGDGHIIGSHTISHPNLALLPEDQTRYELGESKKILESELKQEVVHFSYPNPALYPNWNDHTTTLSRDLGYKTAVLSESGPLRLSDDPLQLKRMVTDQNFKSFKWYLNNTFAGRVL